MVSKIQVRAGEIQLRDDGIVHIDMLPNAEISLKDADEFLNEIENVSDGKKYPLIIDANSITSVERNARKLFSETTIVSAVALVVSTPLGKIIGNFFLGLNKTDLPFKLFSSKTEAFEWLEAFKK